jgi:hypothetical protein
MIENEKRAERMESAESKPTLAATFTHTYYRPGRYFPKMVVKDALGQITQTSTEILVIPRNKSEINQENKMLRAAINAASTEKTIKELQRRSEGLAEIAPNDFKDFAVKQYSKTAKVARKRINELKTKIQMTKVEVSVGPKAIKFQLERAKKNR